MMAEVEAEVILIMKAPRMLLLNSSPAALNYSCLPVMMGRHMCVAHVSIVALGCEMPLATPLSDRMTTTTCLVELRANLASARKALWARMEKALVKTAKGTRN